MGAPEPSTSTSGNAELRARVGARLIYAAMLQLGFMVALVATYFGIAQDPWPDAYSRPTGLDVLRYPFEFNPEMRLSYFEGDFKLIRALPDGENVWIVGAGNMFLHSADGGRNWEPIKLPDPEVVAVADQNAIVEKAAAGRPRVDEFVGVTKLAAVVPLMAVFGAAEEPVKKSGNPEPNIKQDASSMVDQNAIDVFDEKGKGAQPREEPSVETMEPKETALEPKAEETRRSDPENGARSETAPGNDSIEGRNTLKESDIRIEDVLPKDENTVEISLEIVRRADKKFLIFQTEDAGETWSYAKSTFVPVDSTANPGGDWSLAEDGSILRNTDGTQPKGDVEVVVKPDTDTSIDREFVGRYSDFASPTPDTFWLVGSGARVLKTTDGGAHWYRMSRLKETGGTYRFFPAPWYWLVILGCLCMAAPDSIFRARLAYSRLFVRPVRRPDEAEESGSQDEDQTRTSDENGSEPIEKDVRSGESLDSDQPISSREFDTLNFGPLVDRLSKFMRNVDTEPGMTLAITGGWGSGKTSFMNLLREDLWKEGYRPATFNAWHHQKEKDLLLSVLEAIRTQSVPDVWTVQGLWFRTKLLFVRCARSPLKSLVLPAAVLCLLSFAILLGLDFYDYGTQSPDGAGNRKHLVASIVGRWGAEFDERKPSEIFGPKTILNSAYLFVVKTVAIFGGPGFIALVCLATGGFVGVFVFKWTHIYAVNPVTNAFAAASTWIRMKDLESRTQSRERFLRTFDDVATAMGSRSRITVFIDDLDRCSPDHVVHSLEAVNYLSGHGDSYLVLGVDWERLRDILRVGFKDRAHSKHRANGDAEAGAQTNGDDGFVDDYMQKLIQVALRIPRRSPEDREEFAKAAREASRKQKEADKRAGEKGKHAKGSKRPGPWPRIVDEWFVPAIAGLAVVGLSVYVALSGNDKPADEPDRAQTGQAAQGTGSPPSAQDGPSETLSGNNAGLPESEATETPGRFVAGQRRNGMSPLGYGLRAGLLVFGLAAVSAGLVKIAADRGPAVRDSTTFTEVLNRWSALIYKQDGTPRADKRFRNQARFLANMIHAVRAKSEAKSSEETGGEEDALPNGADMQEAAVDYATIILTALMFYKRDFNELGKLLSNPESLRHDKTYTDPMQRDFYSHLGVMREVENDFEKLFSTIYRNSDSESAEKTDSVAADAGSR